MAEGKVLPGDDFNPPPAAIWNNMVDAGRAWADSRLNKPAPNPIRPRETDIIKAKNNSGAVRRLGEILRISGKAIETVTDENKWLLGVEPTDDGYFGILKEPAAISGIASLQVSGCCMALVNVTDADHKRATSAEGEYVLQSGDDGPIEILFAPEGTGEKTCVVRFAGSGGGGSHIIWFTIDQVLCPETDYVAETTLAVTPIWYSHGCEGDPPGADEYGIYYAYDICSYFNGLTAEELPTTIGRATWMYPLTGYCEPRWIIDDLCAQPECNDPEEE